MHMLFAGAQADKLALVLDAGNGVELGEHYDEIAKSLLGK